MTDGRTRYADEQTLEYIAKLEAELARLREHAERTLEAENSRLRDVLEKIADGQDGTGWRIHSTGYAENVQRMAREALYEKV